jgi:hypothetical protein
MITRSCFILFFSDNDGDQQLATMGLSTSQDIRARLQQRLVRRGGAALFGQKFLILVVVTDPIPKERIFFEDGEGSIASANAN